MNRKYRVFAWMVLILLTSCTQADSLPTPSSTSPPASPSPTISATKTQASDYSQLENTLKANRTDYQAARSSMVADFIIPQGIDDPEVIRAMQTVPRHMFVPEDLINEAYEDHPLPMQVPKNIRFHLVPILWAHPPTQQLYTMVPWSCCKPIPLRLETN